MDAVRFPSLDPKLQEIGGVPSVSRGETPGTPGVSGSSGVPSFGEALEKAVASVSRVQSESDESTRLFALGKDVDLHTVLLQVEKADLSFRTMMEVRNKLLEAYREVMRIQI